MSNVVELLKSVNGASFVSIDTRTEPKIRKTLDTDDGRIPNPHFGHIEKLQTGSSVMVFQNKNVNGYANMIAKRLMKEGKDPSSFQLGERVWGTRVPDMPLVEHHGQYYMEVIFLKSGPITYLCDGQPIDKKDIQGMTEAVKGEQGGLDNKVEIRTPKLSSIQAIRINKETHTNLFCQF